MPTLSWPCKSKYHSVVALSKLTAWTAQTQCAKVPQRDASHAKRRQQLPALGSAHQEFWEYYYARKQKQRRQGNNPTASPSTVDDFFFADFEDAGTVGGGRRSHDRDACRGVICVLHPVSWCLESDLRTCNIAIRGTTTRSVKSYDESYECFSDIFDTLVMFRAWVVVIV